MLTVNEIQSWECEQWVLRKHYAKRMPPISYAYGLYEDKELIGVVTYGSPPSRPLCVGVCGKEHADKVLELNRLVLADNHKNHASMLVGRSLRLLPPPKIIVSFADTKQGHVGYVYQATNWLYTGLSAARNDRVSEGDGRHPRTGFDPNGTLIPRSAKHRYVFFVGNRKDVKDLKACLNYPPQPYPKGDSARYDSSGGVQTQMKLL
jgi:hypothetical protein